MPKLNKTLACACAMLLLLGGVALADDSDKRVRKIEIKHGPHCEGDDCPERGRRAIFIGEDGETRVLGDGEFEWFGDHDFKGLVHGMHGGGFWESSSPISPTSCAPTSEFPRGRA